MEGDKSSLDIDNAKDGNEASANPKTDSEEHSETDRPTVQYRLYKRRFAGLVALVSRGF